jgi:hypothetical protein
LKSKTTARFRNAYENLPDEIKKSAKKKYGLWKKDPNHISLKFKKISNTKKIFSIRITRGWRALGFRQNNTMIWFWIGSHSDYDKLLKDN